MRTENLIEQARITYYKLTKDKYEICMLICFKIIIWELKEIKVNE
jgi:hypothetical protein